MAACLTAGRASRHVEAVVRLDVPGELMSVCFMLICFGFLEVTAKEGTTAKNTRLHTTGDRRSVANLGPVSPRRTRASLVAARPARTLSSRPPHAPIHVVRRMHARTRPPKQLVARQRLAAAVAPSCTDFHG